MADQGFIVEPGDDRIAFASSLGRNFSGKAATRSGAPISLGDSKWVVTRLVANGGCCSARPATAFLPAGAALEIEITWR